MVDDRSAGSDRSASGEQPSPDGVVVFAASDPSEQITRALAQAAERLQEVAAAEGAAGIAAISHEVTVVEEGDADSGVRAAFTGKARPRRYVVSAMATLVGP
ncbi:hypothetical protein CLV56_3335 [Mumia flava]|uniref:Uncharacterized protein n=1 Tax=Mumia flava TaxID=1348852 RepID=A0A0B2B6U1_9ACTN|nr:hypothetical protein [Mumia flava]PJJ53837.1 hypothetical protein CLV56_3335 [Mumia flava]